MRIELKAQEFLVEMKTIDAGSERPLLKKRRRVSDPEAASARKAKQKYEASTKALTERLVPENVDGLNAEQLRAYARLMQKTDGTVKVLSNKRDAAAEVKRYLEQHGGIFNYEE